MSTYIVLCKWTDQGRRESASLPERFDATSRFFTDETGGRVISAYLTFGRYDTVIVVEAPDDETLTRYLLYIGSRGYISTETMRGFTADEVRGLL